VRADFASLPQQYTSMPSPFSRCCTVNYPRVVVCVCSFSAHLVLCAQSQEICRRSLPVDIMRNITHPCMSNVMHQISGPLGETCLTELEVNYTVRYRSVIKLFPKAIVPAAL
jgi:hypothetical protein